MTAGTGESLSLAIADDAYCYQTLEGWKTVPLREYRPGSEYERRVLKIARGLEERGAIFAVCMPIDGLLRELVKSSLSEDEYARNAVAEKFMFIKSEPDSVGEYFSFAADARLLDGLTDKVKKEIGARYMCARLDPGKFDVRICRLSERDEDRMRENRLGVLLTYRPNPKWSMLGMVQRTAADGVPLGDYVLAHNWKVSEWPCTAGSRAVRLGYAVPVCFDTETLKSINRNA